MLQDFLTYSSITPIRQLKIISENLTVDFLNLVNQNCFSGLKKNLLF